jgi:RIO kinase 2
MKAQGNIEDSRDSDEGSGQESDDQDRSDEESETPDQPENSATSSPGGDGISPHGSQDISVMPAKERSPPSPVGPSAPQQSPSPPASPTEDDASSLPMQNLSIKDTVASDLAKHRARNKRKHHSKRSVRQAGRPQGSKAKLDTTVKLDNSGVWG